MIERTSTKFVNQATDLIRCYKIANSRLFELASVLVRFDRVASFIVNANHSAMGPAAKLRVVDCVADCELGVLPLWRGSHFGLKRQRRTHHSFSETNRRL
jgi:hypothetical protein